MFQTFHVDPYLYKLFVFCNHCAQQITNGIHRFDFGLMRGWGKEGIALRLIGSRLLNPSNVFNKFLYKQTYETKI